MREDPRRVPQVSLRARGQGEEQGTSPDLLMVRAVLQTLPKAACPTGFEYRLQRRLEGTEVPSRSTNRNWTIGWTGVSLGFAAALVIGFFAFDVHFPVTVGRPVPVAGSTQMNTTPVVVPDAPANMVSAPVEGAQDKLVAQDPAKAAVKDSTPNAQPANRQLPEEIFHTTGSSSGR